ncbi:LuxR C-terminal-related transcriptional regulator [Microbacterium forte]|uniref:LuxR C-terminal-related transcriptional regulator n=1 Tax=Microbacterium forte TaxID=2982533 RepID=UPI00289335BE|nr:LuxR C-terminal-related transcriptional regulator [Microbacterium sp. A(2022)]
MTAIPPPPAHAVERPRLRSRLDATLNAPLSVVVAPAGSGKTVLLSQWATSHPDVRVIWIGLEQADSDPRRLLDHLLSAVLPPGHGTTDLGRPHAVTARAFGRPVLESLVGVFREHPPVVLVLDDLQHLAGSPLLPDLWWLADNVPEHTHLIFSSRIDYGLGWGRHRLSHSLIELRQSDLALDEAASATLLERIIGAPVSPRTLSAVMERTEGWAAGVVLTGLGLRSEADPEQFARELRGTDRLISEYLSEQALAQQPPERRSLLLRLSVLDRMSAELVESILSVDDATSLFEELERESMFLVALDRRREWFRFHPMFRELLRYRLRAEHPGAATEILTAAADWHIARGDASSAIDYLLEAGSWERAATVISGCGREMLERNDTVSVSRWLDALPAEFRATRPDVEILRGMLMMMNGDAARAEDVLREQADRPTLTPGRSAIIHTYLAARVQFRPDPRVALQAAESAVTLLGENPDLRTPELLGLTHPHLLRASSLTSAGRALFLAGDLGAARRRFDEALAEPGAQYSLYRIHLLGSLALLEAWAGRLRLAAAISQEALDLAAETRLLAHPSPADAFLAAALAAIERGTPSAAATPLHEGALRAAANHRTQLMWIAHLTRVLSEGDVVDPVDPLPSTPPPIVAAALEAEEARTLRLAHASNGGLRHPSAGRWSPLVFEATAAALTRNRLDLARAHLDAVSPEPSESVPRAGVEQLILRSWLDAREGGADADAMHRALDLASQHDLVAVFVRAGPEVMRLIADLPGTPTPFRASVLERASLLRRARSSSPELAEQLTDRELEILAYLPTRMTNIELAARCYVSPNTIKTHMAHIYRKLAVPNRNSAVARAQDLGLI